MDRLRSWIVLLVVLLLMMGSGSVMARETLSLQLVSLEPGAVAYIENVVIPAFEATYDVDVTLEMVGWHDRFEQLLIKTAAGVAPDVYMSGAEHALELVTNDLLYPIDREWGEWAEKDDFFLPTLGSSTFEGRRYGVPLYTAPRIWWYRESLFEEQGMDAANPPSTWDELIEAARRLSSYDDDRVIRQGYDLHRINPGDKYSSIQDFIVYLWQAGGQFVDDETYEALFNSKEAHEALRFMVDLKDAVMGSAANVAVEGGVGLGFSRKQSAIYLAGPWVLADMHRHFPDETDDVAAFYHLSGAVGAYSAVFSDWLGIHSASPNKDLAWKLIQEITSVESLLGIHLENGTLSPRRSTVADFVENIPASRYLYEAMDIMRPFPVFPNADRVMEEWFIQYVEVMDGYVGPEAALQESARLWDALVNQ